MSDGGIKVGEAQAHWNVSGTRILKYTLEMSHAGLIEHKLISAPGIDILKNKAFLQTQKWIEKWEKLELKRNVSEEKEANLEEAKSRTEDAKKALENIDNLLIQTLSVDDTVDWELLKRTDDFRGKSLSKHLIKFIQNIIPVNQIKIQLSSQSVLHYLIK